jgi:hypothetical protein
MLTLKDFKNKRIEQWNLKGQIKEGCTEMCHLRYESREDNEKVLPLIEKAEIRVFYGQIDKRKSPYYQELKEKGIEKYYNHVLFMAVDGYDQVEILAAGNTRKEMYNELSFGCTYSHYSPSIYYRQFREILGIEANFPKQGTEEQREKDFMDKMVNIMQVMKE